jgi:chromosome segregation ATPase
MPAIIPVITLLLVIGVIWASMAGSRVIRRANDANDRYDDLVKRFDEVLDEYDERLEALEELDQKGMDDLRSEWKNFQAQFRGIATG